MARDAHLIRGAYQGKHFSRDVESVFEAIARIVEAQNVEIEDLKREVSELRPTQGRPRRLTAARDQVRRLPQRRD